MIRNTFSIIAGLMTSFIVIVLIESIGHFIYPLPKDIDISNQEAIESFISTAPVSVFLIILFGYGIGSFIGGFTASVIAINSKITKSITVGAILMGLGIYNLITIPHPVWVIIIGMLLFLPLAYMGGNIGIKWSEKRNE